MNTPIFAHTWSELRLDLPASDRLEIVIPKVPGIIVGAPRLETDGLSLATPVESTKDGAHIDTTDVPETTLVIPVKAKPPVGSTPIAFTVRANDATTTFTLLGQGTPRFVARRCRWITPLSLTYGVDATLTLRVRNDGTAPAENVLLHLPVSPGVHLNGEVLGVAIDGAPYLRVAVGSLDVGEQRDVTLTALVTDPTLSIAELKVEVRSGDVATTLETSIPVSPLHHAGLNIVPAAFPARVGDRLPLTLTARNNATAAPTTVAIISDALEPLRIDLGTMLPYESRTFTVATTVRAAGNGTASFPIVGKLERDSETIATAEASCTTTGEPVIDLTVQISPEDATFARQIRLTAKNSGLGAAENARLTMALPAHVFAVRDSLMLDATPQASVDGSVPIEGGVDLGTIPIGASRSITLRLRSDADGNFPLAAVVHLGTTVVETARVDLVLNNATVRPTAPAELEQVLTLKAQPNTVEAAAPQTVVAEPAPAATGPEYRSEVSPAFASFVPDLDSTALGRLVLGLYDFVPTAWPEYDKELTSLRDGIAHLHERYMPGALTGTFGAAGFDFSSSLLEPLNALRTARGEEAIERDDAIGVVAGVLSLANASGTLHDMIAPLRDRVLETLPTLSDEEAFGEPVAETIK
jgi:hypothetical protein